MDVPAAKIFPMISDLKNWNTWSPWMEKDPNMETTWGDKTSGLGASYCWKGDPNTVGEGCLEIIELEENTSLKTSLDFKEQGTANGFWLLEENEEGTKVTWGFEADMSSPPIVGRYFGLMMDNFVGPDFERGLGKMKELVESMPSYSIEITEETLGPIHFVHIRKTSAMESIAQDMGMSAGVMAGVIGEKGLEQSGMPFSIYYSYGPEIDYSFCMPITSEAEIDHESVEYGLIEEGSFIRGVHVGPYDNLESSYNELDRYFTENGMERAGDPIEIYVTDPGEESDPNNWITHIYYPI